jgi:hypothetical protein
LDCDNAYAERFLSCLLGLRGSGKLLEHQVHCLFALTLQAQGDKFLSKLSVVHDFPSSA